MAEQNLVQKAYNKDADFETARNMAEQALGITVKSKNDILRASALSVISEQAEDENQAIKVGVAVGAITKGTAKKLNVADLF